MRTLLSAFVLSCLVAAPAAAQRSGTYAVTGTGVDGSRYEGTVQLQATGPQTWRLTWRISGETATGVGVLQGGQLAVGYVSQRETGAALYTVQPDGSLTGIWTQGREGGVGRETLLPR